MGGFKELSPTLAYSLALLVLSSLGTLAAFGGKTWVDDDRPLIRRITRRGWVSLTCLSLALGLGVAKNVDEGRAAMKRTVAEAAKSQQLNDLQTRLKGANRQLDDAGRMSRRQLTRIDDLNRLSDQQVKTLDAQTKLLVSQSVAVDRANAAILWSYDLSKENTNLATTATLLGEKSTQELTWRLTTDKPVRTQTIGGLFFPTFDTAYADIAKIRIHVNLGQLAANRRFDFTDQTRILNGPNVGIGDMRFGLERSGQEVMATLSLELRGDRSEGYPALSAYRDLLQHRAVISVILVLEKEFADQAALDAYLRARPELTVLDQETSATGALLARFKATPAMRASSAKAPTWTQSLMRLPVTPRPGSAAPDFQLTDEVDPPRFSGGDWGMTLEFASKGEPLLEFR